MFFCGKFFLFSLYFQSPFQLGYYSSRLCLSLLYKSFFHLSFQPHYFSLTRLLAGHCLPPSPFWSLLFCLLVGSALANRVCNHRDCQCQQLTKNTILGEKISLTLSWDLLNRKQPASCIELEIYSMELNLNIRKADFPFLFEKAYFT